ncbi:hypothetical protein ACA910_003082 [Epithemia clementina (nom. ined.)]
MAHLKQLSQSPPERLALKLTSTPATSCTSHASSPSISSRTTETDFDETHVCYGESRTDSVAGGTTSFARVPLPSPRRPRLDPRYAARLPATFWTNSPRTAPVVMPTEPDELTPPPGITRNHSIFRPTPILTNMDAESSIELGLYEVTADLSPRDPHFAAVGRSTPRRAMNQVNSDVGMSDRFIASRATSNLNINLWEGIVQRSENRRAPGSAANNADESESSPNATSGAAASSQQNFLNTLLRSELLGETDNTPAHSSTPGVSSTSATRTPLMGRGANNLRYTSPRQAYQENVFDDAVGPMAVVNSFSLTPVRSAASQRLMAAPPKRKRRISKVPFKVLDAPALQDDFYLNLVDWSSQNVLAVGLGSCVYLWSACTSKVTKLCDLEATDDAVTSVAWAQRGTHLAVGTNRGEVQLWDTMQSKKVRSMAGHSSRVGALAWTGPVLASGSRDRLIYLRDVRVQASYTDKLSNHKQEVCGLKWSFDEPSFLASGGNDNHLHVIDSRHPCSPIHKFTEHTAAVKAITWSPHQHGLLASGGGTADRCIRFWNTLSGVGLNKIDTGSQVCNIAWSQNCNEIVSTHGYSLHQIVVWRYPSMNKVATLTGHTYRVLYLAMSPDGSTVVTGAGDETLRFWQIFPGPRSGEKDGAGGLLFPKTLGSVIR